MANGEVQAFGVDIETAAVKVEQVLTTWHDSERPEDQLIDCDDSAEVRFGRTASSVGNMGELHGYFAAEVEVDGHKAVRVGVLTSEPGQRPTILEFDKGKKHWDYSPTEKPPKYVRRTLKALGATGIFTEIDRTTSKKVYWPEEVRVEAEYLESREKRKR